MSWYRAEEPGDADMYLSTDDEGDGQPRPPKKARDVNKEAALQAAELARAKRVAHRQMDRVDVMEIERAFAVLDNVREGDLNLQKFNRSKSKPRLDPSLNPYIDDEAAEARQSDSDMADEESLDSAPSSSGSDGTMEGLANLEISHRSTDSKSLADKSDLSISTQDFPTLYENYCASREQMEAQIQQEEKEKARLHSSSGVSDDRNHQSFSSHSNDDSESDRESSSGVNSFSSSSNDDSESDTELQASFSSVH